MKHLLDAGVEALELTLNRRNGGGGLPPFSPKRMKDLRFRLGQTQQQFCANYAFDISSLKSWETGRRIPEQSNTLLFLLIEREPIEMQKFVAGVRPFAPTSSNRHLEESVI